MTSACERLTNFFNPFDDRASRKREFRDREASSLNQIVQDTLFPIVTSCKGTGPFSRIGLQVVLHIGSFLADRDLVSFSNTNKGLCKQLDKILEIKQRLIFFSIPIFDKAKYKRYWGVEITDEFNPGNIDKHILRRFLTKYFSPNPVDPTKLVKDTCLIPTVVPVRVMVEGRSFDYNLPLLGDIASHPGIDENAAIIVSYDSIGETSPKQACIKIVLRGVVKRGEPMRQLSQVSDALSLATAVLAEYAVRGNRALGSNTGMERCYTYSRTRDFVQDENSSYYAMVGGFTLSPWPGRPAELSVGSTFRGSYKSVGVAIHWEFGPSELEP